jgi:hypothetical protein
MVLRLPHLPNLIVRIGHVRKPVPASVRGWNRLILEPIDPFRR